MARSKISVALGPKNNKASITKSKPADPMRPDQGQILSNTNKHSLGLLFKLYSIPTPLNDNSSNNNTCMSKEFIPV